MYSYYNWYKNIDYINTFENDSPGQFNLIFYFFYRLFSSPRLELRDRCGTRCHSGVHGCVDSQPPLTTENNEQMLSELGKKYRVPPTRATLAGAAWLPRGAAGTGVGDGGRL